MIVHSSAPYYDDYDKSKDFTQILALPGRAEQAREFTQIQSIQRDYLERLGNAVFKDGYVVSGCGLVIDGTTVTILDGQVFIDGLIRNVSETDVQITNSGIERVMMRVITSIVTEIEDGTLRDPAQGYENYGIEGAYREKQVVEIYVVQENDLSTAGTTLYTLQSGTLLNDSGSTEYTTFSDMLAERTYDENGNFKIEGLYLKSICSVDEDTDKIVTYVDAGKAYVHGYEVNKSTVSSVSLNRSTATRLVNGESHVYSSTLSRYKISNSPVSAISNVTCSVQVTEASKNRGSIPGGYDAFNLTPVREIVSISQGVITFIQNTDYKLYSDQIDWSLPGEEPQVGTTYSVTYVYNKTMVEGVDYQIVNEANASYIEFLLEGDKPTENSIFYLYYTYTLARRDLVLLDSNGVLSCIEGAYDKFNNLITPYNRDRDKLELGHVDIYPTFTGQTITAVVTNYQSVRLTQSNIYSMLKRIEGLEMNIAEMDLDREAEASESASDLMGIYTDGFMGITKSDLNYSRVVDGNVVAYDCCIDYDNSELTTPATVVDMAATIDMVQSSQLGVIGNVVSAPFDSTTALNQAYATGVMKVNPYAAYDPISSVKLSPSVDTWVDHNKITLKDTIENTSYNTTYKTYSHGWWSTGSIYNLKAQNYMYSTSDLSSTYAGKTSSTATKASVAESVSEYMHVRDVAVKGSSFDAALTNIKCVFNNVVIPLVATGTTVQLPDGKVQADLSGRFTAKFTIPADTSCGKVNVRLVGEDALGYTHSGQAVYSAEGSILTTTITNTNVITRNYNVLVSTHNLYSSDPLAQSFVFTSDTVITKVGLYFAEKDANRPVVVQVRNVVNGYPGEVVYAEVVVESSDINVPAPAGQPVLTDVDLNQPVYCFSDTFYCFVVLSDSNDYSMFYAGLGETLYNNPNSYMTINPYTAGVLFSSSNSTTWTAHQGSDLKFVIYKAQYLGSGEVIFNEISLGAVTTDGLLLDATYEDYKNAGLNWYYRITPTGTWLPIDTLVFRDLQALTDKVQLKAVMNTASNTSPFIAKDQVSLKCFQDAGKATYISKTLSGTDFEEEYQALKVSYELALPSGASCKAYYMDVENGDWNLIKLDDSIVDPDNTLPVVSLETKQVDEEFTLYTWSLSKIQKIMTTPASTGSSFYKIRIDLETPIVYKRPKVRKLMSFMKYAI